MAAAEGWVGPQNPVWLKLVENLNACCFSAVAVEQPECCSGDQRGVWGVLDEEAHPRLGGVALDVGRRVKRANQAPAFLIRNWIADPGWLGDLSDGRESACDAAG